MSSNHLKEVITTRLREACPEVWHGWLNYKEPYPHIVYSIDTILQDEHQQLKELEINIIDEGVDTERIDNIADTVHGLLDHWYYIDDNIQFAAYFARQQTIEEEDRRIMRRRILAEIHYNERG